MDLEDITSIVNLPGVDFGKLVSLIVKAASTARKFRGQLTRFATYVRILGSLLENQQLSELRKHRAAREVLEQLDIALVRGCRLVRQCKNRSWLYALINGRRIMMKFRRVEEDTTRYLAMFPLTVFSCNGIGTDQLQKRVLDLLLEVLPKKNEKPRKQKKAIVAAVPADQSEKQLEHDLAKKEKNSKQKEALDEGKQYPQPHDSVKENEKPRKQRKATVTPVPADQTEQPKHNLAQEEKPSKQKKTTVATMPADESEKQPEHNLAKKEKNNKQKEAVDEEKKHPQPHDSVKEKEKHRKQRKATVAPVPADQTEKQPNHNLAQEEKRSKQKKTTVATVPADESEKQPEHNLAKKEKYNKQNEAVDEGKQHPQPHDSVKEKEKPRKQRKATVTPVPADQTEEQPKHNLAQGEKRSKQKKMKVATVSADLSEEQPAHHLAKEVTRSEQKDKGKEQLPSDVAQDMGNNDGKVTAVLKVNMHCVCMGCVERYYNPIVKKATVYTGVECVGMELDNRIIIVVGRFDAKKLHDHVSKGTEENKGVDLVGKNYNMPIKVGKVVLKFGTVGLRCNCDGCKDIILDMIYKIKGVKKVCFDKRKNQVIVTGPVDMEKLCKVKVEHKG